MLVFQRDLQPLTLQREEWLTGRITCRACLTPDVMVALNLRTLTTAVVSRRFCYAEDVKRVSWVSRVVVDFSYSKISFVRRITWISF